MKFSLLLVLRQYRRNPLRSAFLYGGMLCAVCLICGTMFGMESLNHCVIVSADSVAAPLIHRAAQLVTLLVAFFTGLLLKNGFLITLEQRMQMLGRLYALGMSHRQMRRMVVLEALIGIGGAFLCAAFCIHSVVRIPKIECHTCYPGTLWAAAGLGTAFGPFVLPAVLLGGGVRGHSQAAADCETCHANCPVAGYRDCFREPLH